MDSVGHAGRFELGLLQGDDRGTAQGRFLTAQEHVLGRACSQPAQRNNKICVCLCNPA